MQKINATLIDDEPGNIVTLSELLKEYCPIIEISGTCIDSIKALELINTLQPQVVFLDIEMPYNNAFDLLDKLQPIHFEVIFVTAFNEYAIKAFKYAALDYLLKPINIKELKDSVQRLSTLLQEKKTNHRITNLLNNLKSENTGLQKIALPAKDGLYFEDINKISHFSAEGSYTYVFVKNGTKELLSGNLKEFEDILPKAIFCRIHHSHIINLNFVKKYYKGRGGYVEMQNGTIIEVSARKREEFLERFK
jgi:two-component system, LytTR family, response regulator